MRDQGRLGFVGDDTWEGARGLHVVCPIFTLPEPIDTDSMAYLDDIVSLNVHALERASCQTHDCKPEQLCLAEVAHNILNKEFYPKSTHDSSTHASQNLPFFS